MCSYHMRYKLPENDHKIIQFSWFGYDSLKQIEFRGQILVANSLKQALRLGCSRLL